MKAVVYPAIMNSINPYRDNVQGKANEPICVAGILDHAKRVLGHSYDGPAPDWSLDAIYERLEHNSPRIAIIGGSADHPAHIMDYQTSARAALRIWQNGGVPFHFSTPVMCDGTAQSNQGMSYSLQSRNAVAQMVVNQLEAHSYHGAFVIQGCDKQPIGVVSAMVHVDRVRRLRGEAPFFATFAPAHVLQGGSIPSDLVAELELLAQKAEQTGNSEIAWDLRDAVSYILQCSSNTAFQGVFERAVHKGLINHTEHKAFEQRLAVSTCDSQGGICAFNGTGNSSRHLVAGMGLVHPAIELLTEPPSQHNINLSLDCFSTMINNPIYGAANILAANIRNGIKIHSASGGSTNLMMHIVASMVYGGYRFTLNDLDEIHHQHPIPDLFDYSLTQGRDIFALAMQCCDGKSRGMETLFHELMANGVPMDLDAPTVTGTTWRHRLSDTTALSASGVQENPIILTTPRRPFSGVDVLTSNFFDSAVVKISGMTTAQLDEFDEKAAFVLYYENEDTANQALLDPNLIKDLKENRQFAYGALQSLHGFNSGKKAAAKANLDAANAPGRESLGSAGSVPNAAGHKSLGSAGSVPNAAGRESLGSAGSVKNAADVGTSVGNTPLVENDAEGEGYDSLFDTMVEQGTLKLAVVIAGQGPVAFGMPEMFTPMQHINANRKLKKLATLISDGRYSGVTYGAAVGHLTPEAFEDGGILYLMTGDLVLLNFRKREIRYVDINTLPLAEQSGDYTRVRSERVELAAARMHTMKARLKQVAASNRLRGHTDAFLGVVPYEVWEDADLDYRKDYLLDQHK
jgi:dihydroxy-acid dehydratase